MAVQYTGGCSVHWGDIMSTPDVFSTVGDTMSTVGITWWVWGIFWVQRGVFSTLGDTMSTLGDTMSTLGDTMSTLGDTMSTLGDTMMSVRGYHEYTGGCSVHWGFHTNSIVFSQWPSPTFIMISPGVLKILRCTAHPPVYCTDIMQGGFQEISLLLVLS